MNVQQLHRIARACIEDDGQRGDWWAIVDEELGVVEAAFPYEDTAKEHLARCYEGVENMALRRLNGRQLCAGIAHTDKHTRENFEFWQSMAAKTSCG